MDLPDQPYWLRALVKLEGSSVPCLQEVLREKSAIPRSYAAYMLGKIGPPAIKAVPKILQSLRTATLPGASDRSYEVSFVAIALEALKQISPEAEKQAAAAFIKPGWHE